ncbi:hypothetical protein DFH09DRAFT_1097619 [Mycena vulgaris]|nr:hypothetical protein DFH09DRAFT_1097619 [Mycena vulgaris]
MSLPFKDSPSRRLLPLPSLELSYQDPWLCASPLLGSLVTCSRSPLPRVAPSRSPSVALSLSPPPTTLFLVMTGRVTLETLSCTAASAFQVPSTPGPISFPALPRSRVMHPLRLFLVGQLFSAVLFDPLRFAAIPFPAFGLDRSRDLVAVPLGRLVDSRSSVSLPALESFVGVGSRSLYHKTVASETEPEPESEPALCNERHPLLPMFLVIIMGLASLFYLPLPRPAITHPVRSQPLLYPPLPLLLGVPSRIIPICALLLLPLGLSLRPRMPSSPIYLLGLVSPLVPRVMCTFTCGSCAAAYPITEEKLLIMSDFQFNFLRRPDRVPEPDADEDGPPRHPIATEDIVMEDAPGPVASPALDPPLDQNGPLQSGHEDDDVLPPCPAPWLSPDCPEPPIPNPPNSPYSDLLLDAACVEHDPETNALALVCCPECRSALKGNRVPPRAVANYNYLGPVPPELAGLTVVEEALIALCRAKCWIIQLRDQDPHMSTTQRGVRGHIIVYPQRPSDIAQSTYALVAYFLEVIHRAFLRVVGVISRDLVTPDIGLVNGLTGEMEGLIAGHAAQRATQVDDVDVSAVSASASQDYSSGDSTSSEDEYANLQDGNLLGEISQPIDDEGWKRWGWERHSPEAADGLPWDTSPSPPGSLTPIKLEPDSVALFQDIQCDTLSPFEKSVIRLVRDSKREGGSFSRWLKGRQKRIEYLEGRDAHHLRLLAEIRLLSKNFD